MNSYVKKILENVWIIATLFEYFSGFPLMFLGIQVHKKKWVCIGALLEIPLLLFFIVDHIQFFDYSLYVEIIARIFVYLSFMYALLIRNEYLSLLKERKFIDYQINSNYITSDENIKKEAVFQKNIFDFKKLKHITKWDFFWLLPILLSIIGFFNPVYMLFLPINGLSFMFIGIQLNRRKWILAGLLFEVPLLLYYILHWFNLDLTYLWGYLYLGMRVSVLLSLVYVQRVWKDYYYSLNERRLLELNVTDKFDDYKYCSNHDISKSNNKILQNLWILPTLIFTFNGFPFIYIGANVNNKKWKLIGIIVTLPYMVSYFIPFVPFQQVLLKNITIAYVIFSPLVTFVYALGIRKKYEKLLIGNYYKHSSDDNINNINNNTKVWPNIFNQDLKTKDIISTDVKNNYCNDTGDMGEVDDISDNLNSSFKIDINSASSAELKQLPGINIILIKKLENIRNQGIKINNMEELAQLWNLTPTQINKLSPYISFNSSDDFSRSRHVDL